MTYTREWQQDLDISPDDVVEFHNLLDEIDELKTKENSKATSQESVASKEGASLDNSFSLSADCEVGWFPDSRCKGLSDIFTTQQSYEKVVINGKPRLDKEGRFVMQMMSRETPKQARERERAAKAICAICPAIEDCLDYIVNHPTDIPIGVRAGLTPKELSSMMRKLQSTR